MFETLAFMLHLLSGPVLPAPVTSPAPASPVAHHKPTCHWLTVDLPRRYALSSASRKRACKWEPTLQREAAQRDLDPDLFGALIIVESRWRPWVVSSANACGLTQVIPKWTGGTASGRRKWTCEELKRPRNALRAGARILAWWIAHRKGNVREGLCGYNAGFRTCKRAGASYARAVLSLRDTLRAARLPDTPQSDAPFSNKVQPERDI